MTEATQRKKRPKGTHASLKMYGVYLVPYSARNPLKFKKKRRVVTNTVGESFTKILVQSDFGEKSYICNFKMLMFY